VRGSFQRRLAPVFFCKCPQDGFVVSRGHFIFFRMLCSFPP
jgi:hypothetical protein